MSRLDPPRMTGLHHVTAICGPAQSNLDFYSGVLGLRLVKRTVNFDDPGTYHLYYGDRVGTPGTIMTFFPWEHAAPGRRGAGTADVTSFTIPSSSVSFWVDRLEEARAGEVTRLTRFGQEVVRVDDPDGLILELVAVERLASTPAGPAAHPDISVDHAIRAFHGVTLDVADPDRTALLLTGLFGYEEVGREGDHVRLQSGASEHAGMVDLIVGTTSEEARLGRGSVHHVAFRARNDEEQQEWREAVASAGIPVTTVQDRNYFRSIYFREPGGVLFEIATDDPGFTVDENEADLGSRVMLPNWLEGRRTELEERLPPLIMTQGSRP